jgi:predicted amidohydrolase YtcJ/erythromycin esterase-like protein
MRRLLLACLLSAPTAAAAQDADLILVGGTIWTGDESRPAAQAVAIRGDRILAVGNRDAAIVHRAAHTRVIELGGAFVVPGFIDNHTHFDQAGALLLGANLLDVSDAAGLIARVREARDRLPPGSWMIGGDWGAYEAWQMGGTGRDAAPARDGEFRPHRALIDSLTPAHPVLLSRWDRSVYLANARALEAAGADCSWEGVECEDGAATGRLTPAAAARIRAVLPAKSMEQRLAEARLALAQLRGFGVTTIHDITPPQQFAVYEELRRRGELTVRVNARPTLDKWADLAAVGISHGFGDDWIRIGGLKGFTDGIMGNSTARFHEPYLHTGLRGEWRDSTNTGASRGPGSGMMPPGNMERMIRGADAAGLWPHVHAIGDEAIDTLITLFDTVMRENGARERRFRIIHTQVIRDAAVAARMARLGIIAEVQPYHAIDDMRWMEERIGERARWAYAFRTLHDAGVRLSFGSDWPGTNASWYPANPLLGIYAAVTRQTVDGDPAGGWFPAERIDVETALRAYTVNNAWAAGEESVKGRIAPGLLADIAVLDRSPFDVPPGGLKDIAVLLTVVGGSIVHDGRAAAVQQPAADTARVLPLGARIEPGIEPRGTHTWLLEVPAGHFIDVVAEQVDLNVALSLHAPGGALLLEVDDVEYLGPEFVRATAPESGTYRLDIRHVSGGDGVYGIRADVRSPDEQAAWLLREQQSAAAAEAWIRDHAIPLATVEAGHGFADMQPLRSIIGDARIVALGEATHGSREFFQLKHRMLEFLVSELGFNIFAIEANLPEAMEVNRYVLTGEGDPSHALAGMHFWTWDTAEVLELIEWMRRYNADPRNARKVSFHGFDAQFNGRAARVVVDYLRSIDVTLGAAADRILDPLRDPFADRMRWRWEPPRRDALRFAVDSLAAAFDARFTALAAATSQRDADLARRHLHVLQQSLSGARDSAMAENVTWILEREGRDSKAVVWAHNLHVATVPYSQGTYMRRHWGDDVRIFGFVFDGGGFQARDLDGGSALRNFTAPPAAEGTLEAAFTQAGVGLVALDLRNLPAGGPAHAWFETWRPTRNIGSMYSEPNAHWYFYRGRASREYDALLFVPSTTAAHPNPTGIRPRLQELADAPVNLDFEDGQPGAAPGGWTPPTGIASVQWSVAVERDASRGGNVAVIRRSAARGYAETAGEIQQRFAAAGWRGRSVTVSAAIRVESASPLDRAHLWVDVTAPRGRWSPAVAFASTADSPVTASEWRRYELEVLVPEDADAIVIGVAAVGDAAAFIDDVRVSRAEPGH